MCTYEQIKTANDAIRTMDIRGKDYAEVNQRIKAFRMIHPMGSIVTELVMDDGQKCVFKATASSEDGKVLGTGTAYELKDSTFINKNSYIENCETSAVGRALAMCGLGIDISVASYEEVGNAIENQKENKKTEPTVNTAVEARQTTREEMMEVIAKKYPAGSKQLEELLKYFNIDSLDKASTAQIIAVYDRCKK